MKNKNLTLITVAFFLVFISCKEHESKNIEKVSEYTTNQFQLSEDSELITEKIMYDVNIVNYLLEDRTKEGRDWFWENLPEPHGDKTIKKLIESVLAGELQAYYYDQTDDYDSFRPIPLEKQKDYLKSEMVMDIEYIDQDDNIAKAKTTRIQFNSKHVNKLRFLEEWYIDEGVFHKRVIAVAPFFTIIYPGINQEFSTIFFWILLNDSKTIA